MKTYSTDKIRNVALLGHGGCGKTTLIESLLYMTKATNRMGKVEDGNTISDYDKEEKERQFSIGTSVIPIEYYDTKINFLDTPGFFDFVGEVFSALEVCNGAVIIVDAGSGVQVGTEKAWKYCEDRKIPRVILLDKLDMEDVNYDKLLEELREKFGKKVVPFAVPIGEQTSFCGYVDVVSNEGYIFNGKECVLGEVPKYATEKAEELKEMLMESVAETNEAMMEKFFAGESFTDEEIHDGLRAAVMNGDIVPIIVTSAQKTIGVREVIKMIIEYLPSSADIKESVGKDENGKEVTRKMDPKAPASAFVFKTIVDPFVGKINVFKVLSGTYKKDMEIFNSKTRQTEKLGNIFYLRGREQIESTEIPAGDIGAAAKLQHFKTGDTICTKVDALEYPQINVPKPSLFMAVNVKSKEMEEKVGLGLNRLLEEDTTFSFVRNVETRELVLGGQGNMHLEVIKSKLRNLFKVEIELSNPKVAYRETIKGKADVQGKHKKQSGGAGQYGDVHIRFEPSQQEFEFAEEIFGGSVPRNYIPAVEKGLRDCLDRGVLAGCKVVNIKATLYDGSYHDVDSNEMAFKLAASIAFKKGMQEAKPILLEPIVKVEIEIPDDYMGDVMGDMNKRRGRILGMDPTDYGTQIVHAEAPQAEMYTYAIDLRSMTQARGSFEMEFLRYDEMPINLSEKVIAEYKASQAAEQ
jgi:elongation factor G